MRRIITIFQTTILAASLLCVTAIGTPYVAEAETASAPSLVISQLKVTSGSGQFVTLYNTTDRTLDMSKYQLEYFNSYDLTKTSSSKLLALSGSAPPHSYFIASDDSMRLCYQASIDSMSLGFSTTAGMVDISAKNQTAPSGPITTVLQDYVSWSKSGIAGSQKLPDDSDGFLQRQPVDAANNPSITVPGSGSWQTVKSDPNDPCSLVGTADPTEHVPIGIGQLLLGAEPPAIIAGSAGVSGMSALPVSDIGLKSPVVNELLPNPAGTGNDSTDEFVELYNPNAVSFDLSGFALEAGLTTTHRYTFPVGTKLAAHGFTAFYSSATRLSLSNSAGAVKLADPLGNSISSSGPYSQAKEGEAWALAKGKWYWTSKPTPGKTNVIKQPAPKKSSGKKAVSKKLGSKSGLSNIAGQYSTNDEASSATPVHTWVLALIGGLALLYGAYEYRSDMANYLSQLRRNHKDRRGNRA